MKLLKLLWILPFIGGCSTFSTVEITDKDGTVTKLTTTAYVAKQQFEAEKACHKAKSAMASPSIPEGASAAEAVSIALTGVIQSLADTEPCGGTNVNDVAIARSKYRWGFGGALVKGVLTGYGIGELADFGKALANRPGDTTYNTSLNGLTQSNSVSSTGGSATGGAGAPGEVAGSGGSGTGGGLDFTDNGLRSNNINIGTNQGIAGDRAAGGETALVNGDSSVISSLTDAECKDCDIAEDIDKPNDQSGFDDRDGNPETTIGLK